MPLLLSRALGLPRAPGPPRVTKTKSVVHLSWNLQEDSIDSYEIETHGLVSGRWTNRTAEGETRHHQIIEIRADSKIQSGYYQLWLAKELNFDDVTVPIAFDASAKDVKSALEGLEHVVKVRVQRCDAAGGAGGRRWLGGCPFGGRQGYSWHVEFLESEEWNHRTNSPPLGDLAVFKETIDASWSGPGGKVIVRRANSLVHRSLNCGIHSEEEDNIACTSAIYGLDPRDVYSFRLRAHSAKGWSAPGLWTDGVRLPREETPSRPPAPILESNSGGGVLAKARCITCDFFDVQYSVNETGVWVDAGRVNVSPFGEGTLAISTPESVVARVRGGTSTAVSPWSEASEAVSSGGWTTQTDVDPPPVALIVEASSDAAQLRWLAKDDTYFEVAMQEWRGRSLEHAWTRVLDRVGRRSPTTSDVQVVTATSEFRLASDDRSTTTIPSSATAADLKAALIDAFDVNVHVVKRDQSWRVTFLSDKSPLLVARGGRGTSGPQTSAAIVEREVVSPEDDQEEVVEAHVPGLRSGGRYRFKVRSSTSEEWSAPTEWVVLPAPLKRLTTVTSGVVMETARGWRGARAGDPDYVLGAGDGGKDGLNGNGGLVVLQVDDWKVRYLQDASYVVPAPGNVVAKLWGAGGGGGGEASSNSTARGGGGGFVQATFTVTEGDVLEIVVGTGGGGAGRNVAGLGGMKYGGDGGQGVVGSGGGGGGASELRRQGQLLAIAGGGGGGGASGHGGGGGGSTAEEEENVNAEVS